MNSVTRVQVDMAVRVRNFLREHPFTEPKAAAVVAKFEERVNRAGALLAKQQDGVITARASRRKRIEIRRQLRAEPFRHLVEIAKAASIDNQELANLFRKLVSNPSSLEFRAGARAFADRAAQHREQFLEYGMRETLIDEVNALIAAYDKAMSDTDAARRAHTGARKELSSLASQLVKMAHQLNGLMLYRTRDDLELGGAWESARNIAYPGRSEATVSPPIPGPMEAAA